MPRFAVAAVVAGSIVLAAITSVPRVGHRQDPFWGRHDNPDRCRVQSAQSELPEPNLHLLSLQRTQQGLQESHRRLRGPLGLRRDGTHMERWNRRRSLHSDTDAERRFLP